MVQFSGVFLSGPSFTLGKRTSFPDAAATAMSVREAAPEYRAGQGTRRFTPQSEADELDVLEEEITTLAAHIHAATHRLLTLIAEFDRRRGWELGGHLSCAHWLHFRTGIDLGAAREKVRAARALETLPETSASMARGELSFSKVRALTRVATPENESDLLALAQGCTTAQLERVIRAFRPGSDKDEAEMEEERHRSRWFSIFPDSDGMYVIRGRLPAEVGALVMRAVEAASDSLYREEGGAHGGNTGTPHEVSRADAARRRADALGLLAEWALAAGFESGPVSGSKASRYQVVLHVEPETLKKEDQISRFKRELLAMEGVPKDARADSGDGATGRSHIQDGPHVSAETSRRISCDCGVVRVEHDHAGSILSVGRKTRSISPALRRALEIRDQGCRFPGCGHRFADAHHVKHWADGGETSLDNTLLLCSYHHRLVHEGGWTVDWWGRGHPVFMDPRGHVHFEGGWQPPHATGFPERGLDDTTGKGEDRDATLAGTGEKGRRPHGAEALIRGNLARGVEPGAYTASARWKREVDIPGDVLWPAEEALIPDP